jgi:hypothetical protein
LTGNRSLMSELVQETRRLIPQLGQLLDDRLSLPEPAIRPVSRLAENAAQIFGEPANCPFDAAAAFHVFCPLRHLASDWITNMMPLGCLCQFQGEDFDAVLKDSLLNSIDRQRVDVVVYLEQRLPDVVRK